MSASLVPISVLTDSYKATHSQMYPDCTKMVAYGEFRAPFKTLPAGDNRFVFFGMRYLMENYINRRWTLDDVEKAERFFNTHNAGGTPFPWPKDLFERFIKENDGYFPVRVECLPEGSVVHVHTPVYQITTSAPYAKLCTFFETLFTHIWYPTTVATLSRRCHALIAAAFDKSVDNDRHWKLGSRLHDFGFRGCTCTEQAVIGGTAHLLSFDGSDTMAACYYAQFHLNDGKPVGGSIPATEHSVMTSWRTEREALELMIDKFGKGVYACVLDSYDYTRCLNEVVPALAQRVKDAGGSMIYRPDSGRPVDVVLEGLRAADATFGHTVNSKGFKVINHAGVIQGDGINATTIVELLDAVLGAGYSAECVAFGMGGGLLQKVNRDSMSFATKLSHIVYPDGEERDIMKFPKTDGGKCSLPGMLRVTRDDEGRESIHPVTDEAAQVGADDNLLKVVYDQRPIADSFLFTESFETIRERVNREWQRAPAEHDPISPALRAKMDAWVAKLKERLAATATTATSTAGDEKKKE